MTLLALWGGVLLLGGARLTLLQPADTVPTVRAHAISTPNNTVVRNDLIRFHLGPTLARQELYGGFFGFSPAGCSASASSASDP